MKKDSNFRTIVIKKTTKEFLDTLKAIPTESYDALFNRKLRKKVK